MKEQFERTQMLFGDTAMDKLAKARVIVFGIGGVGGHVCEVLVRAGIGEIDIVDNDVVSVSNLNRQIIATNSSIGRYKVDVMKERLLDINSDVKVNIHNCFYLPENRDEFDFNSYDYVVDAIDTVTAKLDIIEQCNKCGTRIISSMGTGNKINPTMLEVADIYETVNDALARVMRRELRKRGINSLKVVYSKEDSIKPIMNPDKIKQIEEESQGKRVKLPPGSTSFVPSACGIIIGSEVIKDIIFC
ncbi:MAG: tRNA threonylcarbamoyladenosine dehydratase [Butyrivibrio sp.]|nr:tRNA threonylcarbamoyladenosine dehydratase [Butyrivibrio sp.]